MDDREIRLRIVEVVLPTASRNGLSDPDRLVDICSRLEKYVVSLESKSQGELSDPEPKRRNSRPRKGTTEIAEAGDSVDPTHGG